MIIFLLLVAAVFYWYYQWLTSQFDTITGGDEQLFENTIFSTQAFYNIIEAGLCEKEIPGLKFCRIFYRMGGRFTPKREYLRITYKGYVFDVCAAPFVHDFFVSWRQGRLRRFSFFRSRREKTFYEMDTEAIFLSAVKLCINRAVTQMIEIKAQRSVSTGDPS